MAVSAARRLTTRFETSIDDRMAICLVPAFLALRIRLFGKLANDFSVLFAKRGEVFCFSFFGSQCF